MKKFIAVILFFIANCSFAQLPLPADSIYQLIKANSIYRNNLNWNLIDKEFKNQLDTSKTLRDTMKCFVHVFEKLDDLHSAIYFNNNYYGYYRTYSDSIIKLLKPLLNKSKSETGIIKTTIIENKYAYIQIPGINAWGAQIDSFARIINDSICKFNSKTIKGFIVDLRLNGGGNLYPMLSGLSSLLGEIIVGSETDITGKPVRTWEIRNNNFFQDGYHNTNIKSACKYKYSKLPVVVLISSVTQSSGSITAIAFKQRPQTFFIGEPTAEGYTTSNNWYQLKDNFTINLATAFVADRNNNVYKTTVDPDLKISYGDNYENLLLDKKGKAAIEWLKKNSR